MSVHSLLAKNDIVQDTLSTRFNDWSDCYAFMQREQSIDPEQSLQADVWVRADELWALVLHQRDSEHMLGPTAPDEFSPRLPSSASSFGGFPVDDPDPPDDQERSPTTSLLERAVDEAAVQARISVVANHQSAERIMMSDPVHHIAELGENGFGHVGGIHIPKPTHIVDFLKKHRGDDLYEQYFLKRVEEWRAPEFAKRCVRNLFTIRRPSLLQHFPTALLHFYLVESSSMILVSYAWFLIMSQRVTDAWMSGTGTAVIRCFKRHAYTVLLVPWDSTPSHDCKSLIPEGLSPHTWDQFFGNTVKVFSFPTHMIICFYIPLVVMACLVLYRNMLCLRYNGLGNGWKQSFASGRYALFCWELARNRTHKILLACTLSAFVISILYLSIHGHFTGVSVSTSGAELIFFSIVLLQNLKKLGQGSVPDHKFHGEAFFTHAVFKRSWLALLTESNYEFSTRLMDALWRCKAGDLRDLRAMLEPTTTTGKIGAEEFYALCEKSQVSETREMDRKDEFEVDEEELPKHAHRMFGDDLDLDMDFDLNGATPERALAMMKSALNIQAETETNIEKTKRALGKHLFEAKRQVQSANKDKQDAVARCNQKEKELADLRSLGEKLYVRERECARLRAEAQQASSKDSRIARLTDENRRLRKGMLTNTYHHVSHSCEESHTSGSTRFPTPRPGDPELARSAQPTDSARSGSSAPEGWAPVFISLPREPPPRAPPRQAEPEELGGREPMPRVGLEPAGQLSGGGPTPGTRSEQLGQPGQPPGQPEGQDRGRFLRTQLELALVEISVGARAPRSTLLGSSLSPTNSEGLDSERGDD